jgi:hypothetical protein
MVHRTGHEGGFGYSTRKPNNVKKLFLNEHDKLQKFDWYNCKYVTICIASDKNEHNYTAFEIR